MSHEAHRNAIAFSMTSLLALRSAIHAALSDQHVEACALANVAVGFPHDDTSPAGRLMVALSDANNHLAAAFRATSDAMTALQDYERNI